MAPQDTCDALGAITGLGRQLLASQGHQDNDAILSKGQCPSQTPGLQVGEDMGKG